MHLLPGSILLLLVCETPNNDGDTAFRALLVLDLPVQQQSIDAASSRPVAPTMMVLPRDMLVISL
jgi:hypothetical protein